MSRYIIAFVVSLLVLAVIYLGVFEIPPRLETYHVLTRNQSGYAMYKIARILDEIPQKDWPNQLRELVDHPSLDKYVDPKTKTYLQAEELVDSLTGADYIYFIFESSEYKTWCLASPGPNKIMESELSTLSNIVQYDVTNGSLSRADWIFTKDMCPRLTYESQGKSRDRKGEWFLSAKGWNKE